MRKRVSNPRVRRQVRGADVTAANESGSRKTSHKPENPGRITTSAAMPWSTNTPHSRSRSCQQYRSRTLRQAWAYRERM
jgi:hypothetical protein